MENNLSKRSITFLFGLFVMSMAVALSVKANLGVSPISCIPYIFSVKYPLTMGQTTIIFNVFLILLQILLLRKNYQLFQLIQLPVVIIFGFFTDFSLSLVSDLEVTGYFWQMLLCLFSCALLAFGVFLEVKASITYLAGEGVAMALVKVFKLEFGKAKIGTDSSMVIVGALCSFLFYTKLMGAREGTIIAALLVGFIVRFYNKHIRFVDAIVGIDSAKTTATQADSKGNNLIITISREYGSGGHDIGERVSELLSVPFYDRQLIKLTALKGNYSEKYVKDHEQKISHFLFFELYQQSYAYINEQKSPLDVLFSIQSEIIKEISKNTACVIVGRCANFILKDQPHCFNVFIHADSEFRKKRIAENKDKYNVNTEGLEKMDQEREQYSMHFTGEKWDNAKNYHLTLDSSQLGVEESAQLIVNTIKSLPQYAG